MRSHGMEELVQGDVLAASDLAAAAVDGPELCRGSGHYRETVGEVDAERFPDELRAGPVLGFSDLLHRLDHFRWEGDGHGLTCPHGRNPRYYLVLLYLTETGDVKGADYHFSLGMGLRYVSERRNDKRPCQAYRDGRSSDRCRPAPQVIFTAEDTFLRLGYGSLVTANTPIAIGTKNSISTRVTPVGAIARRKIDFGR